MRNIQEVIDQKVQEYHRIKRQVEALRLIIPLLMEEEIMQPSTAPVES